MTLENWVRVAVWFLVLELSEKAQSHPCIFQIYNLPLSHYTIAVNGQEVFIVSTSRYFYLWLTKTYNKKTIETNLEDALR